MRRFFRVIGALLLFAGTLLLVVSFTPLVSWMARDIAVDWFDGDADVLVVLGGSMLVDGTGPQASLGYDSYLRCTYAWWMIQRHPYTYVVVSGPDGLAQAMQRYLAALGAPQKQLLMEDSARSTEQNAEFVKSILDHQGGLPAHPTIAILTSDYHTWRAKLVFEHAGMKVRAIPVPDVAKRIQFPGQRWDAFLILMDEFAKDAFYKLKGRI